MEKHPPLLPPSKRPHISIEKREAYLRRKARAFFDPDDRHGLDEEWMVLHYLMLAELSLRCRRVFRLFFVEQLKPEAIASQLNIEVDTAKSDLVRALTVVSHEQREVERGGVGAKGT